MTKYNPKSKEFQEEARRLGLTGYQLMIKYKESEEEVKKWDDLFHTMKLDNCPVLRNIL